MDILYVVIPAYNEAENIRKCVDDWYPIVEANNSNGKSRLIVVDDGSKDETHQILIELAVGKPFLLPLRKPNGGHGSAVLYGYRYAIEKGSDYIFKN